MTHYFTVDEAQEQLTILIDVAVSGEEVFITKSTSQVIRLVPVAPPQVHRPHFGSGKGLMIMSEDFDEPLVDFDEYMR